jgi:hypothetical protein
LDERGAEVQEATARRLVPKPAQSDPASIKEQRRPGGLTAPRRATVALSQAILQVGLLYVILQAYSTLRKTYFLRPEAVAFDHARQTIDLEAGVGLPVKRVELALQARVLEHGWLIDFFNVYYRQMKPAVYVCAALAVLLAPAGFRRVRRLFVLATLIALPWYTFYPLAPPRLMDRYGYPFVDTLAVYAGKVSSSGGAAGANQFAAMPSMHIGWSIVAAFWLAVALPRWRLGAILGGTHVVLMSLTVMATGNHYWLDIAGGLAVVAAALALDRLLPGWTPWFGDNARAGTIAGEKEGFG